jgi:hypothetical protein
VCERAPLPRATRARGGAWADWRAGAPAAALAVPLPRRPAGPGRPPCSRWPSRHGAMMRSVMLRDNSQNRAVGHNAIVTCTRWWGRETGRGRAAGGAQARRARPSAGRGRGRSGGPGRRRGAWEWGEECCCLSSSRHVSSLSLRIFERNRGF